MGECGFFECHLNLGSMRSEELEGSEIVQVAVGGEVGDAEEPLKDGSYQFL